MSAAQDTLAGQRRGFSFRSIAAWSASTIFHEARITSSAQSRNFTAGTPRSTMFIHTKF